MASARNKLTETETVRLFTEVDRDAELRSLLADCASVRAGDQRAAINYMLIRAEMINRVGAEPWTTRLIAIVDRVQQSVPTPAPEPEPPIAFGAPVEGFLTRDATGRQTFVPSNFDPYARTAELERNATIVGAGVQRVEIAGTEEPRDDRAHVAHDHPFGGPS